jgi:hypothetical protein
MNNLENVFHLADMKAGGNAQQTWTVDCEYASAYIVLSFIEKSGSQPHGMGITCSPGGKQNMGEIFLQRQKISDIPNSITFL